jgi:hypothetical protein
VTDDPGPGTATRQHPKVFGIGMFKTGTTTLGRAMERLGYRAEVRFWPLLPGLAPYFELDPEPFRPFHDRIRGQADAFDCLADAPWLFLYRELAVWYPESVFVLTLRKDARSVAESDLAMWHRIGLMERWRREVGLDPTPEMFVERYERHNEAVMRFFASRAERLLTVCWETEPHPWQTLCGFVGRPVPEEPFPHENRAPEGRREGAP